MKHLQFVIIFLFFKNAASAQQHSVARLWNEITLEAISGDFARPTVHARNLFHISAAMYDAWAVYNPSADTYFLGKTVNGFHTPYRAVPLPADAHQAQSEAVSFAAYRMLRHRYAASPGFDTLARDMDALMRSLGYDHTNTSTNYHCGPAEMGNYIAKKVIEYGNQDGANEANNYANQYYKPVNPTMLPALPGNPKFKDLNRWQPLEFPQFVDQSGHSFSNFVAKFQAAEWGNVLPFSLDEADLTVYQREGHDYKVWLDPGPPALLDTTAVGGQSEEFKWNFALVAAWSSVLDPADGVVIDISPASQGNNVSYPKNWAEMRNFYDFSNGGDHSTGHDLNPITGQPYAPQLVRRGDYTRVLAEFWADGPRSVTPPGHWFEILNYVNDQPDFQKRVRGTGPICEALEWDVKGYFALGGAMHDAAIVAWGIKGWYDFTRPVNAIRGMAEYGQSSDPALPNYHPAGLPLIPGFIEIIQPGEPLAGQNDKYAGEIKLKAWRGPNFITDPKTSVARVGWIRAANWWPYQRPTFVTPPFAGYISGHSTYSRTAAELLTELTGDAFFPGGMGEFFCKKNQYLVFEDGPSEDITLQWATYRDASDQCSLSRIFGGIHPPMDDIPGRQIGIKLGPSALAFAEKYFIKTPSPPDTASVTGVQIFPNPTDCVVRIDFDFNGKIPVKVIAANGREVISQDVEFSSGSTILDLTVLPPGVYMVVGTDTAGKRLFSEKVLRL